MTLFGSVLIERLSSQRRKGAKDQAKNFASLRLWRKLPLFFQQLLRVPAGAVGDLGAGEHARHLLDAARLIELTDAHLRAALQSLFLHHQMAVGKARNLRLVRDTQYLVRLRKLLEFDADRFADATANPCIDLVENDRARKLRTIRHSL